MLCRSLGVLTLFLCLTTKVNAAAFTDLWVFGDSASDTGNVFVVSEGVFPPSPPYFEGRWQNGPAWVEHVAAGLGLPNPEASLKGGSNFAFGGAQTGGGVSTINAVPNLGAQIAAFMQSGKTIKRTDLVVVWGGHNDLLAGLDPVMTVSNLSDHMTTLHGEGARHFLVGNYGYGFLLPEVEVLNPLYTQMLSGLASSLTDTSIYLLDFHALQGEVLTTPEAFGFRNAAEPACADCILSLPPEEFIMSPNPTNIAANPDEYAIWDLVHPTGPFQQIMAERALSAVLPPATEIYTSHDMHTRLGRINSVTGAVTDMGPYGLSDSFQASGAFDMDGTFYTLAAFDFGGDNPHTQLATVDTTTGAATLVGSPMDTFVLPLEVDSSNTIYTMRFVAPEFGLGGEPVLYTVDSSSGQLTAIGNTGVTRAMDLAFSSDGTLWVVGGADEGNQLYTIDLATGASTFQTTITGVVEATGVEGAEIMGIMFDENDTLLATSFFGGSPDFVSPLFAIDTTTGVATTVGDSGFVNPHGGDTLLLPPPLQAGDANQDLQFDQFDLIKAQQAAKYLTGQTATWGEGDWNGAPGGRAGNPPAGDGVFDQQDLVAAQQNGLYGAGGYAAILPNGEAGDAQTSVGYDASSGEIWVDSPAGSELTSINIDSASGIFTGDAAQNLGGSFDNDADNNIFKATFGGSFGSLTFGNVAQAGLAEDFLVGDLTVVGSLAGGGDLGPVDLVYIPEPSTMVLLSLGLVGGRVIRRRRPS